MLGICLWIQKSWWKTCIIFWPKLLELLLGGFEKYKTYSIIKKHIFTEFLNSQNLLKYPPFLEIGNAESYPPKVLDSPPSPSRWMVSRSFMYIIIVKDHTSQVALAICNMQFQVLLAPRCCRPRYGGCKTHSITDTKLLIVQPED